MLFWLLGSFAFFPLIYLYLPYIGFLLQLFAKRLFSEQLAAFWGSWVLLVPFLLTYARFALSLCGFLVICCPLAPWLLH